MKLEFGPSIIEFTEKQDSIKENRDAPQPWIPKAIDYFQFDPNTLDSAGWVALGFSPKQSAAIIKYRHAGAVFRKSEDVKKLFVVDEAKYAELEPYIIIKELPVESKPRKEFKEYEPKKERKFEPIIVELNAADTTQLQQLHGIGSSFAKRIVKYRELLGGYTSKEQVLEVYGMDSARYLPIAESLLIDTTYRVRININTADFKTLLRHPYLNKNQVNAIINYRKQHGLFSSLEELAKIHLINDEALFKIKPYLKVD
ncbi:MAG: helix-hairpin-helix domain-containing protein [Flavobacteriales bacterium]|nr:helix-hairpin-helix domain-containing protein [Flavobacteriales bacterium]